jgi:hypothetical protein
VNEVPAGTRTLFLGPLISTRGGGGWENVVPIVLWVVQWFSMNTFVPVACVGDADALLLQISTRYKALLLR